jgi:toxin CcdB
MSAGRVMMPLVRVRRGHGDPPDHALTPHLTVPGQSVHANPLDVATIPKTRLKDVPGMLPDADQERIMQTIDEMPGRA